MTKKDKIEYILEIMPNVSKIIKLATDEQIENLFIQAQEKFHKFRFDSEDLTEDDLKKLDDYMSCLTDREKEVINSVVAKGNSYQETADYMGISRSTV